MGTPHAAFANAAFLGDPDELSRAEGWRRPPSTDGAARNGGLRIERVHGYGDDTVLVRFARLRDLHTRLDLHPAKQLAAGWWLTEDMFTWLLTRVFGPIGQASRNIEQQMLLPPEWNEADCVVRAFPRRGIVLGAWFGRPRTVLGTNTAPRVMQGGGATQTEAWMYQLYVPGLAKRPHNAANWLEFEGIYSTKPRPGRPLSYYPCIRPGKRHR